MHLADPASPAASLALEPAPVENSLISSHLSMLMRIMLLTPEVPEILPLAAPEPALVCDAPANAPTPRALHQEPEPHDGSEEFVAQLAAPPPAPILPLPPVPPPEALEDEVPRHIERLHSKGKSAQNPVTRVQLVLMKKLNLLDDTEEPKTDHRQRLLNMFTGPIPDMAMAAVDELLDDGMPSGAQRLICARHLSCIPSLIMCKQTALRSAGWQYNRRYPAMVVCLVLVLSIKGWLGSTSLINGYVSRCNELHRVSRNPACCPESTK